MRAAVGGVMAGLPCLEADWPGLLARLPPGFDLDATARASGAFRRPRGVGGAALLNRLRGAEAWLGQVAQALLAERLPAPAMPASMLPVLAPALGTRVRRCLLADATCLREPGADRASWRLHVGCGLQAGRGGRPPPAALAGGTGIPAMPAHMRAGVRGPWLRSGAPMARRNRKSGSAGTALARPLALSLSQGERESGQSMRHIPDDNIRAFDKHPPGGISASASLLIAIGLDRLDRPPAPWRVGLLNGGPG